MRASRSRRAWGLRLQKFAENVEGLGHFKIGHQKFFSTKNRIDLLEVAFLRRIRDTTKGQFDMYQDDFEKIKRKWSKILSVTIPELSLPGLSPSAGHVSKTESGRPQ